MKKIRKTDIVFRNSNGVAGSMDIAPKVFRLDYGLMKSRVQAAWSLSPEDD